VRELTHSWKKGSQTFRGDRGKYKWILHFQKISSF
jgi:hypothetical protein